MEIGDNVSISIYSIIITGSHDKNSDDFAYRPGQVVIHDNVWIGARGIILDNSIIGWGGGIIGAGSTFKGTAEQYGIYCGCPAVKTGERTLNRLYDIHYAPFFR